MADREGSLIAAGFGKGDAEAFAAVQRRVRRILSFRGWGIDEESRRDVEQLALTQIWEALQQRGFDKKDFWGFVEVVVARRAIDWRRKKKEEVALGAIAEPATTDRGPFEDSLLREQTTRVRRVLGALPQSCQQLIRLHLGDELSYRELASRLDSSEGALRVRMHRCIQQARKLIREADDVSWKSGQSRRFVTKP